MTKSNRIERRPDGVYLEGRRIEGYVSVQRRNDDGEWVDDKLFCRPTRKAGKIRWYCCLVKAQWWPKGAPFPENAWCRSDLDQIELRWPE